MTSGLELFSVNLDYSKYLHWLFITSPIWVALLLFLVFFDLWVRLKRREWIEKQGGVLLEVKIPREISKSPASMELFFNTLYNPVPAGGSALHKVYLEGTQKGWYSLELVSIGGVVHFYIWCLPSLRQRVETQLYAQIPNIEVHEVPDYSLNINRDPEKTTVGWIGQFKLNKADAYPIKTYIDYGLDKDPKEEFKQDPLVSLLEFLGSLSKGEQAWIQILIQAHSKEGLSHGRLIPKPDWKDSVDKEIKEILKKGRLKPEDAKELDSTKHLSQGQRDVIEAIERTTGKSAFDTMIRATYFADNEVYDANNIGGLIGSISQFNVSAFNGFGVGWRSSYDYPWQDPFGKNKISNEKKLFEAYKRRSFFHPPFKNFHGKPFILSTEELATIYHFPGSVAGTPTLSRLPSKKAEAPPNLPT